MRRTTLQYLDDILEASKKIQKYIHGITYDQFAADEMRKDAVIRNFEIIGEAIKNLPGELKDHYPGVYWKKIAGFRDVLSHVYFGIRPTIIWDNAVNKLPGLKTEIRRILKNEESEK